MSPLETIIRERIAASPLAKLLGLEFVSMEKDRVTLRLPFRPEVTTVADIVHGGAIAALIDTTATAAAWSGVEVERQAPRGTTIGLTINYLSAGRGSDLTAEGRVVRRGKTIIFCEVNVTDTAGARVAQSVVTYKLS